MADLPPADRLARIHAYDTIEAIRGGHLDAHLEQLRFAIHQRMTARDAEDATARVDLIRQAQAARLHDPEHPPTDALPEGQVWVWLWDDPYDPAGPPRTRGRWEPRGTGARL